MIKKEYKYNKVRTYFLENKLVVALVIITGLIFNGLMCFVPLIQGKVINNINENQPVDVILKSTLLFCLFVFFVQINRFLKRYFVRIFSNKITYRMRVVSYNNIINMDISRYKETKGEIISKNLNDIADLSEGIRKVTTEVFDSFVLILCYLISLFIMDYKISFIITIFLILAILCADLLKRKIYKEVSSYKKVSQY